MCYLLDIVYGEGEEGGDVVHHLVILEPRVHAETSGRIFELRISIRVAPRYRVESTRFRLNSDAYV